MNTVPPGILIHATGRLEDIHEPRTQVLLADIASAELLVP